MDQNLFTKNDDGERGHLKAILFSALSSLVFLCFSALLFRSEQPAKRTLPVNCPSPAPIASPQVEPRDPNEKFRIVPSNFMHVDFENRSYGRHRSSSDDWIDLKLTDGKYEYSDGYEVGGESFHLSNIYFTDVTGDESLEAIVLLQHFQYGVSSDGGSALFFVYTTRGDSLKEIWQYETGSYGYGCGLKSLTVMKKQFTVQMFGKCSKPRLGYSGPSKFLIADTTLANFRLSRGRFVKTETDFFAVPDRDVKNYDPQIHIIE